MRILIRLPLFLSLIFMFFSCGKESNEPFNFYNMAYRKGLWVSRDKRDTLDFKDNIHLIRKGEYYSFEEYIYRIEDKTIFIKIPGSDIETEHPILKIQLDSVVIGNMYAGTGFTNNSGTFIKVNR